MLVSRKKGEVLIDSLLTRVVSWEKLSPVLYQQFGVYTAEELREVNSIIARVPIKNYTSANRSGFDMLLSMQKCNEGPSKGVFILTVLFDLSSEKSNGTSLDS